MSRYILFFLVALFLLACEESASPVIKDPQPALPLTAQDVIARSVAYHGGDAYDTAEVSFIFRDRKYTGGWNHGAYEFTRSFTRNEQDVQDILTADSFQRLIDGKVTAVPDTMVPKYSASVNSVWYFAYLPFRLMDPAVQARLLGEHNIDGTSYYKVEVTFSQEGGGEDFEDVFVYWFDQEDYSLDYLAYSYAEDHGIGLRFREAFHLQEVAGIRFQDYVNYKADPTTWNVADLDSAFTVGALDTLSLIELEEIKAL